MKTKKLIIAAGILLGVGLISQIVERSLDKPAIQEYFTKNFKEVDTYEEDFNFKDEQETNFITWLGF